MKVLDDDQYVILKNGSKTDQSLNGVFLRSGLASLLDEIQYSLK